MNDGFAIAVHCPKPECLNLGAQGTTLNRPRIEQMLEKGEDIVVIGGMCGHTWSLSPTEKRNLHNILAQLYCRES